MTLAMGAIQTPRCWCSRTAVSEAPRRAAARAAATSARRCLPSASSKVLSAGDRIKQLTNLEGVGVFFDQEQRSGQAELRLLRGQARPVGGPLNKRFNHGALL